MESLFVVFVLLAIGVMIYGFYAAKKRRQELAAWAVRRDLTFTSEKEYGWDDRFGDIECLSKGKDRFAHNISRGQWSGLNACFFDYHYKTESTNSKGGKSSHHHNFSAVIIDSPIPLKRMFIRPEGFFDKITQFFGYDDIDFESAEFSRKFYVKSADRKWAYDVIHQGTMDFMLKRPAFTLTFSTGNIIAYRSKRFSPDEFESAADLITGILDRLPDYVVQQRKELL